MAPVVGVPTVDNEPEVDDEVVHISGLESGEVIAKYEVTTAEYTGKLLDVKIGERKIRYSTPMTNWKVIRKEPV